MMNITKNRVYEDAPEVIAQTSDQEEYLDRIEHRFDVAETILTFVGILILGPALVMVVPFIGKIEAALDRTVYTDRSTPFQELLWQNLVQEGKLNVFLAGMFGTVAYATAIMTVITWSM